MKRRHDTRLLGRREMILKTGGVFALFGMTGAKIFGQNTSTVIATPQETEGPYWVDEMLNRADLTVDPTDNSVQPGLPLVLNVTVSQLADGVTTPVPDAWVDIWHCNAAGLYSDEQAQNTVGRKFLRGYQVTDDDGAVRFLSIYPGWYSSRTVHIHARVRLFTGDQTTTNITTQFFFDESITDQVYAQAPYNQRNARDTLNTMDSVFTTLDCNTGQQDGAETLLKLAADASHVVGTYNIVLSPGTPVCAVSGGGPGGPGGPGGFPGGPRP